MEELNVRIVRIEAMRAASTIAVSKSPELEALSQMRSWAAPNGLLDDPARYHLFGFNNPPPEKEGEPYGYQVMLTVEPDIEVAGKVKIDKIPGGTYAVTRMQGTQKFPQPWIDLYDWCKRNNRKIVGHGLEEHIPPHDVPFDKLLFDLWLPIEE